MGGDKLSVTWCQPIGLMHVVGRRGSVLVSAALKRDGRGGKNSNRCSSETQEKICLSKVGEGKRKESAMYD